MWARRPVGEWARHNANGHFLRPTGAAWKRALKLLGQLDYPKHRRYAGRLQTIQPGLRAQLLHGSPRSTLPAESDFAPLVGTLAALPPGTDALTSMLHLEQRHFLADHNLNYLDKTAMAFGVEGRVPLLDLEFVEFAAAIPSRFKMSRLTSKYIFKKAMEPFLPLEAIYRSKTGFGVPLRRWMTRDLKDLVRETLSPRAVRARGVFDDSAVQTLIDETQASRIDGAYPLFSVLAFETWCRLFLDRPRSFADNIAGNIRAPSATV